MFISLFNYYVHCPFAPHSSKKKINVSIALNINNIAPWLFCGCFAVFVYVIDEIGLATSIKISLQLFICRLLWLSF